MQALLLYPLLTTAMYYLLSQATITQFLWSRYPQWLDSYTSCAACSGTLYGAVVALAIGWTQELPFLGLSGRFWMTPFVVAGASMVWTPLLADLHIAALLRLGSRAYALPPTSTSPEDSNAEEA